MSESHCLCSEQPYQRFQGDAPGKFAEFVVDEHEARFPPRWRLRCGVCGTRWSVVLIPYGGIYGDFDWERVE